MLACHITYSRGDLFLHADAVLIVVSITTQLTTMVLTLPFVTFVAKSLKPHQVFGKFGEVGLTPEVYTQTCSWLFQVRSKLS